MRRRPRTTEMFNFSNPSVPFQEVLQQPLKRGATFTIQGTVHVDAKRFSINLQSGKEIAGWPTPDKAFHFCPRFQEIAVVRNTFENNWGPEERFGTFPFHYGQYFTVVITVLNNCYKVSVNSVHFAEYIHRIPFSRVNTLAISGDVILHRVSANIPHHAFGANSSPWMASEMGHPVQTTQDVGYPPRDHFRESKQKFKSMDAKLNLGGVIQSVMQMQMQQAKPAYSANVAPLIDLEIPQQPTPAPSTSGGYPIHLTNLVTPANVNFPGNLAVGHTIYISATPTGSSFGVYFEKGVDVAFLFNPRFISSMAAVHNRIQSSVVRNSLQNGQWGTEEKQLQVAFPFQLNQQFDLLIKVLPDRYDVTVNGRQLATFAHRIFPISQVTNMAIKGDVNITSIYVQK